MKKFPSIQKGNKLHIFSTFNLTISFVIIKHLRGGNVCIFNKTTCTLCLTRYFTTRANSVASFLNCRVYPEQHSRSVQL